MTENSRTHYVTPFGKELRKLRIDYDENQGQQAKRLAVAAGTLSRVEKGHTSPGADLVRQVVASYALDDYQCQMIEAAAEASVGKVVFDFAKMSGQARERFYDRIMALKDQLDEFERKVAAEGRSAKVHSDKASPALEEAAATNASDAVASETDAVTPEAAGSDDEHSDDELERILAGTDDEPA